MSRDRWDDDPSPRRSRYDEYDDDYGDSDYGRPQRSGAVTGVAVINFVLGGLVVLFGLCGLLGALVEAGEGGRHGGPFGGMGGLGFAVAFVIVLFILLWGIGAIVSGVGVVQRRQWGRVLTLILGGIAAVAGLLSLFAAIMIMASPAIGHFDDIRIMVSMIYVVLTIVFVGYCIWVYVVLLNSRYGAEFG